MIRLWLTGLVRRRAGRLLATSAGITLAVGLIACLGSFLAASEASMTQRALADVAVDWQVDVRPPAQTPPARAVSDVLAALHHDPGTGTALPVGFATSPGFTAAAGTTQTTGAGVVLGLPAGYDRAFPGELRLLSGSLDGPLIAQQTAANLQVRPGSTVTVRRSGLPPYQVRVAGVVDLPQADSLFQRVGAAPQGQPVAPPDNVVLVPASTFTREYSRLQASRPDVVTTQVHVHRTTALPSSPSAAYVAETGQARNLEAATSGTAVVGDNVGATLGAAREDAAYARLLFLFLAAPGVVLAAALTAAVARAGAGRRREEQRLLRARGASTNQLLRMQSSEGLLVAAVGGVLGLLLALAVGRAFFGSVTFGGSVAGSAVWLVTALATALLVSLATIVAPARRELTGRSHELREDGRPRRWARWGLDLLLIAGAVVIVVAAGQNKYTLVLAPEGVPTISVSYWAFLAPALAWMGGALLVWRIVNLLLGPGRQRLLTRMLRPVQGNLAKTGGALLSRQRRIIAWSTVVVSLALAFAISTATFNATYKQQAEVDAQLTNGADVTVTESPGTSVGPSYGSTLAAVSGVKSVASMQHRFAYVGADLQDLYGIDAGQFAHSTSLQDPYFQGATASQAMSRLQGRPDGVLVSAETVNDYQLHLGDLIRLRVVDGRTHGLRTVSFHYAGIVNEFPTAPKDSFIVANASYLARQTGSDAVGTFLLDTGGTSLHAVAADVRRRVGTGAQVSTLDQARGLVGSSLTSVDLSGLTRVELAFALCIAAASGGLVMGIGLAERRRSMALARAVGASEGQLRRLTAGEPLFVGL
ncbi:MAG: FtsX-like permease family protein, partial [Marmoricola sp.]|nr:FtsX-like permease family protein [Marmoricola sp.]